MSTTTTEDTVSESEPIKLVPREWPKNLNPYVAAQIARKRPPFRSCHGILAEFGPGPTEEEIDENRRDMLRGSENWEQSMIAFQMKVTSKVIGQVIVQGDSAKQIALPHGARYESLFSQARKDRAVLLKIGGILEILLGDIGCIWRSQQQTSEQLANFDQLYELLARFPDKAASFLFQAVGNYDEPSNRAL